MAQPARCIFVTHPPMTMAPLNRLGLASTRATFRLGLAVRPGDGRPTPSRRACSFTPRAAADAISAEACKAWVCTKEQGPLVQCITNFVSMDLMANTLLAAGASPAMVHSSDEVDEFVDISSGLLINVGTLTSTWVAAMKLAIHKANATGKPWVLDPVGAGATAFRTKACVDLLKMGPTVVRGNGSEILALAGAAGESKGVDSLQSSESALEAGQSIARAHNCIVAISGATDLVTDGERVVRISNGVPMLTKITATGCSVTALITAFVAANPKDQLTATAAALAVFGVAAEQGAASASGPGTLRSHLLDNLYGMTEEHFMNYARVSE